MTHVTYLFSVLGFIEMLWIDIAASEIGSLSPSTYVHLSDIMFYSITKHITSIIYLMLTFAKNIGYSPTIYGRKESCTGDHNRGNIDVFVFLPLLYLFSAHLSPIWQHVAHWTFLNAIFFTCLSTHPPSLRKYEVTAYPEI